MVSPTLPSHATRLLFATILLSVTACATFGQQTAARPDRGAMPGASYSVSDIESVSLTNGNLNLSIPLASLPPIAGGKLKFTLNAVYNSKLWNVTRQEHQLPLLGGCANWVASTPQLSDLGGWTITGGYRIVLRDAHEDFDYIVPDPPPSQGCETDVAEQQRLQYHYYKTILITPDGAEHELRPHDTNAFYGINGGSRSYLFNYYKDTPNSRNEPLRYYSFDGSFIYAVINPSGYTTAWTIYLNDGTKVTQTNDGVQRITDNNGNSIKISSAGFEDEQTGRKIQFTYDPAGNGGQGQGHVLYQTVGGVWESIDINYGTTTVQGKVYQVDDWNSIGGETGGGMACFHDAILQSQLPVIREIVFPVTEPGQPARKFSFGYNSDTTESATDQVKWGCCSAPESYTRTASHGMGELSQVTTPSGAAIAYTYSRDGSHKFLDADSVSRTSITQKQVTHDGVTDAWTYAIDEMSGGGTVTAPDGSVSSEQCYALGSGTAMFSGDGMGGLVYRSNRSNKEIVERHWVLVPFDAANTGPAGSNSGFVTFNPIVDAEYTSLLDGSGNRVKMSVRTYQYDYNGNLLQETDYDWFDPALVTYGSDGLPTGVPGVAIVLRTTSNSYHNSAASSGSGNVYAKRILSTATPLILSALQQTTTGPATAQLSYDGQAYGTAPTIGNLTSKSVWDDVDSHWITTSTTYNSYGNVTSATDARGKVAYFYYDDSTHAAPTRVVVDPQNGTGTQIAATEYDFSTGLVKRSIDPNGNIFEVDYTNQLLGTVDPFGRPAVTKSPALTVNGSSQKHRVTNTYLDSARQMVVATDLYAENDKLLKTRTTTDMLGRPILSEQTEDGTNYTIYSCRAYDQMGKITYASSPMRYGSSASTDGWSRVTNDNAGRVVEVATFGGDTQPPATGTSGIWTGGISTAYDANFTTVTDQAGKQRRSKVDGLGRLVRVDEPDTGGNLGSTSSPNQPTIYGYDVFGNLLTVTQGSQTPRTFTYDSLSRLRTAFNPESGTITYSYDDNGNLLTKTDGRSIVSTYIYDALNRATSRSYSDGTPAVTYSYDSTTITNGKGRLASVSSSVSTYNYGGYDALGRVGSGTQTVGSQSYTSTYSYELSGHIKTLTYPSGRTVTNTYDNAGRLQSLAGNLGDGTARTYASGIVYDAGSRLSKEQFGTTTPIYNKLFYNSRGQLSEIRESTSYTGPTDTTWDRGAIINHYSNACAGMCSGQSMSDNNGNLKKQEVYIPNSDTFTQFYEYDSLNRLQKVNESKNGGSTNWQQQYSYDRFGNRLIDQTNTWGTGIPKPNFGVDPNTNRLTAPAGYSMSYDPAGNLTFDNSDGIGGTRTYDAENRMKQAWANNQWQTYTYDGDGKRVKRNVNGTETWQVYGLGGESLAEYAANASPATPQKEYGYRNGQMLITADAGSSGSGSSTEDITWTNAVGVSASGNSLTKTAAEGWGNAGAASTQVIASGDGYAEFSASGITLFGLSHVDADQAAASIDFGWHINGSNLYVFESGVNRGLVGTVVATDRLRVAVESGVMKYYQNGTLRYTSTVTPTYPLLVDSALYTTNSTITNVEISANPGTASTENVGWTNTTGVSVSGNSLTKIAAEGWGNAGAASTQSIISGDGYAEFSASGITLFGLSHVDADQTAASIDFGWHINGSNLYVFEAGVNRGLVGTVTATDRLRVSVESGVVKYRKNGTVIYTSTIVPTYPLLVDTALYTTNSTITNVVINGNLSGVSTENVGWTNTAGVTASGNSLTKTAAQGWGNAGAASTQSIISGDGYAEFSSSGVTLFGLSHVDVDQNYASLEFGMHVTGNDLYVYESGVQKGQFGTVAANDRLRVSVESGVVKYRKNGTVIYTSTATPTYPLLADTALYTTNSTITNVVISGNLSGGGGSSSAEIKWLVTDQLGTPRMVFDQSGSLANMSRHDYLPFGEEIYAGTGGRSQAQGYTLSDNVRQKFTSKERDNETGLDYFGARYYGSMQGRFTSVDPLMASGSLGSPQSWNRYSYCFNNPLRFTDPSGMLAGDFYNEEGKRLGTDGINDKKVYVVTDNAQAKQIQKTEKQGGTTQVSAVGSAVELPGYDVRQAIGAAVDRSNAPSGLDKDGGSHEEGLQWGKNASGQEQIVNAAPGAYSDVRTATRASVNTGTAANPAEQGAITTLEGTAHVHPKAEVIIGPLSGNGTIVIGGKVATRNWTQPPSPAVDIPNAATRPGTTNVVVGARDKKVYIYDGTGVRATFPLKQFREIK